MKLEASNLHAPSSLLSLGSKTTVTVSLIEKLPHSYFRIQLPNDMVAELFLPELSDAQPGDKVEIPLSLLNERLSSLGEKFVVLPVGKDHFEGGSMVAQDDLVKFCNLCHESAKQHSVSLDQSFFQSLVSELPRILERYSVDMSVFTSFVTSAEMPSEISDGYDPFSFLFRWMGEQIQTGNIPVEEMLAMPSFYGDQYSVLFPSDVSEDSPVFLQKSARDIQDVLKSVLAQFESPSVRAFIADVGAQVACADAPVSFVSLYGGETGRYMPIVDLAQYRAEFETALTTLLPNIGRDVAVKVAELVRFSSETFMLSAPLLSEASFSQKDMPLPLTASVVANVLLGLQKDTTGESRQSFQAIFSPILSSLESHISSVLSFVESASKSEASSHFSHVELASKSELPSLSLRSELVPKSDVSLLSPSSPVESVSKSEVPSHFSHVESANKSELSSLFSRTEVSNKNEVPSVFSRIENDVRLLSKDLNKLLDAVPSIKDPALFFGRDTLLDVLREKIGPSFLSIQENNDPKSPSIRNLLGQNIRQLEMIISRLSELNIELPMAEKEKCSEIIQKMRDLSSELLFAARRVDGAVLLAKPQEFPTGKIEQTIMVPFQVGEAQMQVEWRIQSEDSAKKRSSHKKDSHSVAVHVALGRGGTVLADMRLTGNKQLRISLQFTNPVLRQWFVDNKKDFVEALSGVGIESIHLVLPHEKKEIVRKDVGSSIFDTRG